MSATTTSRKTDRPSGRELSVQDLVLEFESLGENVELGYIQRECGTEPLGLFRFTGSSIDSIIDVLETNLEHLFTGDDLEMTNDLNDGRFWFRSRHYNDFNLYAYQRAREMSVESIIAQERKKFSYLKRRFLEDLKGGGKIFVRKGNDAMHDLRRLQKALAAHGPHELLLVSVADADHPAGTVDRLEAGLLRGYVSEFKICLRPEPFDVASWLDVMRAAYRMIHPAATFVLPRRLEAGTTWQFGEAFKVDAVAKPERAAGVKLGTTYRIEQDWSLPTSDLIAWREVSTSDLAAQDMVVFSAWVHVPHGFTQPRLVIFFEGSPTKHEHPVNLKRLGRWQRIWSTARVPRDSRSLKVQLRVEHHLNMPIGLGPWAFEKGSSPSVIEPGVRERFTSWRAKSRRAARLRSARAAFDARGRTSASICAFAEILIAHGAFLEADDLLSEAMAAAPDDAALAKMYALSAHNSGRYVAAGLRWGRALSLNPDDAMCFAGFASNLREHTSIFRARDVITSALARFPHDMVVLTEAARIAEATQQWAEALSHWEKAIEIHGSHPELVFARDRARQRAGA